MVKMISADEMHSIIENRKSRGQFIAYENDKYIACDNTTGDAWIEEFETLEEAINWLE